MSPRAMHAPTRPAETAGAHGRLFRRTALAFALGAVCLSARGASADVLLPGTKRIPVSVSFTMEDKGHLVAYPSDCMDVDLKLNPHLRFVPNYDVLDTAKPREPYKFCGAKTALYVLDEATFPKTKGTEEASWRRSEWRIEALDKIPVDERAAFFASNAGVRATGYTMPAEGALSDTNPLSEIRERVTVAQGKAAKAEITYVYTDAVQETFPYQVGKRPQPSRKSARDWMPGLVDSQAAPAPSSTASSSGSAAPAANASSCGCSVPGDARGAGFFLTFVLGLGLAAARRSRHRR